MERDLEQAITSIRCGKTDDYAPLYEIFSKAWQRNLSIHITPKIKENIPFLSTCDSGQLWPIAQRTMPEFEPSMLVPPLDTKSNPFVPVTPPRLHVSPHPGTIPTKIQLPVPQMNTKTIRMVQVRTARDMIPNIAASAAARDIIPGQFYCTPRKSARPEYTLNYKVHRKKLPMIPINPDQKILNLNGMMQISRRTKGEFTPMKQYLHTNEKLFLTSTIPLFNNWIRHKFIKRWNARLKMKRFNRIKNSVLNSCPLGHTEFIETFIEFRDKAISIFQNVHALKTDGEASEEFKDLVQNSNESLQEMREKMRELITALSKDMAHFIFQVRGISKILRADYQVLKTIEALPAPVVPYSFDDDNDKSSLTGCQVRAKILNKERRRAYDRKNYLSYFFIMFQLYMRDFLTQNFQVVLKEFYHRFIENPPTRMHQVDLLLDPNEGLVLAPSRAEFLNWFNVVDRAIKDCFFDNHITLEPEIIEQIFPNNDCPTIELIPDVAFNHELQRMRNEAIQLINEAYDHFEEKLTPSADVMTKLQERLGQIGGMKDFDNTDDYISITKEALGFVDKIASLSRIATYKSLFSDMKCGKAAIYEQLKGTIKIIQEIGIAKVRDLYEDISINKNEYLKKVSLNKTEGISEETEEVLSLKKLIKMQCNSFLPLAECIVESYKNEINVVEIQGQIVSTKETILLVDPPKIPKRVRRVKRNPLVEEFEANKAIQEQQQQQQENNSKE